MVVKSVPASCRKYETSPFNFYPSGSMNESEIFPFPGPSLIFLNSAPVVKILGYVGNRFFWSRAHGSSLAWPMTTLSEGTLDIDFPIHTRARFRLGLARTYSWNGLLDMGPFSDLWGRWQFFDARTRQNAA